jgi:hypothetical protein
MLSSAKEEKMPKLTDSQSMVLSKAAAREDGVAVVPRGMNKAAAAKVGSSFVARKLMREIRSKPGMSIWREENGRNVSLVITRTGRDAIGVENDTAESDRSAAKKTGVAAASERGSIDDAPRPGSKQALRRRGCRPAGLNSESSSAFAENKSSILRVPASNHFGFAWRQLLRWDQPEISDYLERLPEFFLQVALPLRAEVRRRDDQRPLLGDYAERQCGLRR